MLFDEVGQRHTAISIPVRSSFAQPVGDLCVEHPVGSDPEVAMESGRILTVIVEDLDNGRVFKNLAFRGLPL